MAEFMTIGTIILCRLTLLYINAVFASALPQDKTIIASPLTICQELRQQIIARGDSRVLAALQTAERGTSSTQDSTGSVPADIHERARSAFAHRTSPHSPASFQEVIEQLVGIAAGQVPADPDKVNELLLAAPDPQTGQVYDSGFAASTSYYLRRSRDKSTVSKVQHLWLPAALGMLRIREAARSPEEATQLLGGAGGGLVDEEYLRCGLGSHERCSH